MISATCKTGTPLCRLNSSHVANRPSLTSSFTRRVNTSPKKQVVEVSAADSFGSHEPEDAYREVCAETVKTIGEDLMKSTYQPESVDLIGIMQEVGQSLGFKVEYSRGRISVVATAGIAHQQAASSLTRRLDDEQQHWKCLNRVNLLLPCESARRQPDIIGWRRPVKLDVFASHTSQRPDWICEILSAETKKQDLPDGDKFNEYAASGIPHYWIVDPLKGRIFVYELVVNKYLQVQEVSLSDNTNCVLQPFSIEFDTKILFEYII